MRDAHLSLDNRKIIETCGSDSGSIGYRTSGCRNRSSRVSRASGVGRSCSSRGYMASGVGRSYVVEEVSVAVGGGGGPSDEERKCQKGWSDQRSDGLSH